MKAAIAILLAFLSCSPAQAGHWENQHLADTGGSRLIAVTWEERQTTEAYVENGMFRLRIGCYQESQRNTKRTFSQIMIGNGDPFAGSEMTIAAVLDGSSEFQLGTFGYAGGTYHSNLPPQVIAMLVTATTITLSDRDSNFQADFTLNGAFDAIKNIECMGEDQ